MFSSGCRILLSPNYGDNSANCPYTHVQDRALIERAQETYKLKAPVHFTSGMLSIVCDPLWFYVHAKLMNYIGGYSISLR